MVLNNAGCQNDDLSAYVQIALLKNTTIDTGDGHCPSKENMVPGPLGRKSYVSLYTSLFEWVTMSVMHNQY